MSAPPERARGSEASGAWADEALPALVLDHLPTAAAYLDRDQRYLLVNAEWERFHGASRRDVVGRRMADVLAPDALARLRPFVEQGLAGERTRFEDREPDKFGSGRHGWTEERYIPDVDAAGRIRGVFTYAPDVTACKEAEAALADSEGRLRTLLDGIPQLVWRSCDEGLWTWSSPQWRDFTGQTMEESLGRGWLDAVHPDDRAATVEAWEAARGHGTLDCEYRVRRASDGAHLWHHTRSVPVRDGDGRIVEWLGTTTDIQRLKELQERQEVMVAELQHRTRNLIAVVRSIAEQTLASAGPGSAFAEEFGRRLGALARVQGLLSRAEDEPITLGALIRSELDALGAGDRATLEGPRVRVRAAMVQTLALALHELATNARKHGALADPDGRLEIRWDLGGDEGDDGGARRLRLDWIERARRPIERLEPARDGYGRRLIEHALPYALGARTHYMLTGSGVRCLIDLPLERLTRKDTP